MLYWGGIGLLGIVAGFIAGLLGVGGGFIINPLLALLFGVPMELAVGTGLCQMIGTAAAALLRYRKLGLGEPRVAWLLVPPALLGTGLGKRAVDALKEAGAAELWLRVAFAALLVAVAWVMMRPRGRAAQTPWLARVPLPPHVAIDSGARVSAPALAYIGLGIGFLSGLLGVGGGILLTPALVGGAGLSVASSAGTGAALLLGAALVGTAAHAQAGNVSLPIALMILVGSTIAAQFGAQLAARLPQPLLKKAFVALIALMLLVLGMDLYRLLVK